MSSISKKRPKSKQKSSSSFFAFLQQEPSTSLFPPKEELLRLFAVLVIAFFVAVACNYAFTFFNSYSKPFCDNSDEIGGFSNDPSITYDCEPCPKHGKCSQGIWECFPGYKKRGRLCVEDGEINQTAKQLAEWLEHYICGAYGQYLCEGTGRIWFQEAEILKELDEYMLKDNLGSENDTSIYVKQKAMKTIGSSLEAVTVSDGIKEIKCPDMVAEHYKPISCRIRQWIYKHAMLVLPVSALFLGFTRFLLRVRWTRKLSTRAEQLYEQVCDILEENATMTKTVKGEGEPWVVASHLRDHLLLPRERKDPLLWRKVEELVQEDSRLEQYPKLVKGESRIVWEWQVEGSLSSKRGKKATMSKMKSMEHTNEPSSSQQMKTGKLLSF